MTATYLDSQLGIGVESVYGTRVAPTLFLPFLDEGLQFDKDFIESKSYRAGRRYQTLRRPGAQRIKGPITLELAPQGLQILLRQMTGTLVTTGAGPYLHTLTPGPLVGQSLSMQKVITEDNGSVQPFDYSGIKITDYEIGAQILQIATLKLNTYGIAEDTAQTVATATYPSNWLPFTFVEGSLTVAGVSTPVKSFTLKGDLGFMTERFRLGSAVSKEPVEASVHTVTGTLDADFTSLTAYTRFTAQTQAALAITLAQAGGHQLVISSTVEFDGETPKATGMGNEIRQNLPFTGVNATSDANVITMALTNADATP